MNRGYRVFIPTAGTGSRLGELTRFINKSLVSVAHRPALSHIIEQFPQDTEFVLALGYKGHLVREFVELAYSDRRFLFVEVEPFEGPESGLGLSLLKCREHLNEPFIFTSCDTLVKEPIPPPAFNWMGFSEKQDISSYRTIKIDEGQVVDICEKGAGQASTHKAYVGLAGVFDHALFWKEMEKDLSMSVPLGEVCGLRALLNQPGLRAHSFTWYDTGSKEAYALTQEMLQEEQSPNILEKTNEAIWFVGNKVIKFSDDQKFIQCRVKRAQALSGFVPPIVNSRKNMYMYRHAPGSILSKVVDIPLFQKLLEQSQIFWRKQDLQEAELQQFHARCLQFYREKTRDRVQLFYKNFSREDNLIPINGIKMPMLEGLLSSVDWQWISEGLPGRFHGDFHFENILWNPEVEKFTFLDWRQDFAGDLVVGDIYYDLAKLLHGLIVDHGLIIQNQFSISWESHQIHFEYARKKIHMECEEYFKKWLDENGYDKKKVYVLTALIYLNIAALHHYPYSLFLYALGKKMLFEELGR